MKAALAETPADTPDIPSNIAGTYAKKVEKLAEALNRPEDRDKAADTIRWLIERATLTPGPKRSEVDVTLQGKFGVGWLDARERKEAINDDSPGAIATRFGVSSKLVAGTGFEPVTFRL